MSSQPASVPQQFITLITTAFGIVAALAWSDALTTYFKHFGLFRSMPLLGPFLYAGVLTLLAYGVGRVLGQYAVQPCTRVCASTTPEPSAQPGRVSLHAVYHDRADDD